MDQQIENGLKFIGSGNAFNVKLDNNSAYRILDRSIFLIDCGGSVFRKILINGLLNNIEELNVLITHTHPDHIGSLGDLIFYSYYKLNIKLNIIYPNALELNSILYKMGINSYMFNMLEFEKTVKLQLENSEIIEIEAIKQKHVDSIDNFGYVVMIDKFKCFYSGDSNEIRTDILERFDEFQIFYQDTCGEELMDNPHLSLKKLSSYFEMSKRKKIFCMHLDEKFDRIEAVNQGFNVVVNEN